jgi:hypothetical protein
MPTTSKPAPRLHEMSFDPVLGTHLWIEVLTDRVSEGRAAGLSPATLSTPAPGDGGRCGGETGLADYGVAEEVRHAEVVQQTGHIEELGVVFQSVSLGQDRAPGVAPQTVVEQRLRRDLRAERLSFPSDHRVRNAQAVRVDAEGPRVRAAQQSLGLGGRIRICRRTASPSSPMRSRRLRMPPVRSAQANVPTREELIGDSGE